MSSPTKGDVVIAYFPQEDQDAFDLRPCLVLSVGKDCFVAAKITTTELRRPWAFKFSEGKSATIRGQILKDSWVNLRRCENIPLTDAKQIAGTLKPEVLDAILLKLKSLTKN
jgi:mRNA-degrading endonuclease toxin of MazEF toxin-antitoxin module